MLTVLGIIAYKINGKCPVYREGNRMVIDDPQVVLDKTDKICTHALSTILHYSTILEHNWCPVELGLTREGDQEHAYLQCVDPGRP